MNGDYYDGIFLVSKYTEISQKEIENKFIVERKEEELLTIPYDYYGFSKYVIYQRSLNYNHFYNLRIFNIFHEQEEPDRFIKSCFLAKNNNTSVTIFEDKFFDFVYEDDFIKIINFYFENLDNSSVLEKTINICYKEKYQLSDIAKLIINNEKQITILKENSSSNYSGNGDKLENPVIKTSIMSRVVLPKWLKENDIYVGMPVIPQFNTESPTGKVTDMWYVPNFTKEEWESEIKDSLSAEMRASNSEYFYRAKL